MPSNMRSRRVVTTRSPSSRPAVIRARPSLRRAKTIISIPTSKPATRLQPLPRLVLLDLRLPGLDGLGVLEELRATPRLRDLPIVVLSTSASEPDLEAAYRRRANGYLVKPLEFSALRSMLRQTVSYWLGWNRLPRSLRAEPPWAEPATGRDGGARGVSEGAECDPERSS